MSDYRDVSGVKLPFSVTVAGAAQTIIITLTKAEVNTPIDESIFSRPGVK